MSCWGIRALLSFLKWKRRCWAFSTVEIICVLQVRSSDTVPPRNLKCVTLSTTSFSVECGWFDLNNTTIPRIQLPCLCPSLTPTRTAVLVHTLITSHLDKVACDKLHKLPSVCWQVHPLTTTVPYITTRNQTWTKEISLNLMQAARVDQQSRMRSSVSGAGRHDNYISMGRARTQQRCIACPNAH